MGKLSNEEFEAALDQPVTTTAREFAQVIHSKVLRRSRTHTNVMSCPCEHLALWYLGVTARPWTLLAG